MSAVVVNSNFLPFVLFTLPAGVWVDRLPRKPILVIGDLGRFVVLLTIPIAYVSDVLTLWQLYVVAFLIGVFTVFFDVAYQSYLPSLVDRDQLREGNSKLEISRSTAQLAGPGLGGSARRARSTAPYAVLVDAFSFLASGTFLLRIRKTRRALPPPRRRRGKPSLWRSCKEGLRFVLGNPNLRARRSARPRRICFFSITFSIYLVFLVREWGCRRRDRGLASRSGASAPSSPRSRRTRISTRFGIGPTTIVVTFLNLPAMLLIAARSDQLSDPVHRGRRQSCSAS